MKYIQALETRQASYLLSRNVEVATSVRIKSIAEQRKLSVYHLLFAAYNGVNMPLFVFAY